jgi:PhzF family phenazine biosynthesis protein
MTAEIFQVDAFTRAPFAGNPAAVCLLEREMPEAWMAGLAAEMNLSETAFVQPGGAAPMPLRWFTPTVEVPLCGHATLATAHVLWETGRLAADQPAAFATRSGTLGARRAGDAITLDLPARRLLPLPLPDEATQGLRGARIEEALQAISDTGDTDWLVRLPGEPHVRALRPDFSALRALSGGLIATAPASTPGFDFVSRYFAPFFGVDEDPVTGAAHCALVPYWSALLGRSELCGYQASRRGGVVRGRPAGTRVELTGHAVTVLQGRLSRALNEFSPVTGG